MAVGFGIQVPLLPIEGLSIGVASAGIKHVGRTDLVVFELSPGSTVGAVFTKNAFCAAPVKICQQHLQRSTAIRYLVINTGNANAGTGKQGFADALETCHQIAAQKLVEAEQVLPFSTGVIGEYLPMKAIISGLPKALASVSPDNWSEAATGILTTDTRPKGLSRQLEIDGETITVTGIAKGSGMIRPNMATMLAYIGTDAAMEATLLQKLTTEATEMSFNRITVDSDTSTNDSCVVMATGKANIKKIESESDPRYLRLLDTVKEVMLSLAHQIIRDGEGASKFIEVRVEGALSTAESLKIAYSVADSPLFKTAMSASDANWGRILMAVGKCDIEDLNVEHIDVFLGDVAIVEQGERAQSYTEAQGASEVAKEEILVRIVLNRGNFSESVWTSDLSHEYVTINAEYRT